MKGTKGGKEVASNHPGQALVECDANGWTGAGELRAQLTLDSLLWGAGYALVVRDRDGDPRELHLLLPTSVIATFDPATSEPSYEYNTGPGNGGKYSWRDMIVIRSIARTDNIGAYGLLSGLAPIRTAKEAIALASA